MTVRLPKASHTPPPRPGGGTWLALVFLLLCGGGFIAITSMILPQIRGLVLVVGGMSGFIALHYVTWGRWMIRISQDQTPANRDIEQE